MAHKMSFITIKTEVSKYDIAKEYEIKKKKLNFGIKMFVQVKLFSFSDEKQSVWWKVNSTLSKYHQTSR